MPSCRPFLLQGTGPSSSEPPEKERRRLKESFENYRRCGAAGRTAWEGGTPACTCSHCGSHRKRALRKVQNSWRQDEGDRENTTGSDNTDTEGS